MKQSLFIFCTALLLFSMSSCTTYVDGGGYARPGHAYRSPVVHPHNRYASSRYFSGPRYHPSQFRAPPRGHVHRHHGNDHHPHWKAAKVKGKGKKGPVGFSNATWLRL